MMRFSARGLIVLAVMGGMSASLRAQCPDGSPPPCGRARSAPPVANSVAVLYFETRDTSATYLADGLTEDLTSLLGSVAGVQVKSSGVVRRAQRMSPGNMPTIARALAVRYLVDGTVRRVGARVRVSTQLLNGSTGVTVWGDVFDRTLEELLALPSVIAREVAARVGGPASASASDALATLRTRSPAAYDHYLRGNFFLALRSQEGIARALGEYQEAERLDSGFTGAIGRAAYVYAVARSNHSSLPEAPLESLVVRGLVVADRALRRDSMSSDAWMARAFLLSFATPQTMEGALQAFQRALALDPKNAEAHHQYAQILNYLERHDDADRELHLALALDPSRVASYADLSQWTRYRDTALAVALGDSAVSLDPVSGRARRSRALARLVAGDVRGAREDADLANGLEPGDMKAESVLALALARAGDSTRALALIAHWAGSGDYWILLGAMVAVGDTAEVLDRLERATPDPLLWSALLRPEFDALRGNPRYVRLVAAWRPLEAVGP